MVTRPLDPAIKPWPAPTGVPDPPAAALELGRQQIEGDHEEDPALQERHQPANHRHDQACDNCDGHQRFSHGETPFDCVRFARSERREWGHGE